MHMMKNTTTRHDDVAEHLRQAQNRYEQARTNAQVERDEAIRLALAEGWTQRQIAAAMGISPGRVGQIATQQAKERTSG